MICVALRDFKYSKGLILDENYLNLKYFSKYRTDVVDRPRCRKYIKRWNEYVIRQYYLHKRSVIIYSSTYGSSMNNLRLRKKLKFRNIYFTLCYKWLIFVVHRKTIVVFFCYECRTKKLKANFKWNSAVTKQNFSIEAGCEVIFWWVLLLLSVHQKSFVNATICVYWHNPSRKFHDKFWKLLELSGLFNKIILTMHWVLKKNPWECAQVQEHVEWKAVCTSPLCLSH